MNIPAIQRELARFAEEREWEPFHSPKNLAMALAGEVGELIEVFQWLTEEQSRNLTDPKAREALGEEIADVAIYLMRLADQTGIDLEAAVAAKMAKNAERYPVGEARGNATKYNRR